MRLPQALLLAALFAPLSGCIFMSEEAPQLNAPSPSDDGLHDVPHDLIKPPGHELDVPPDRPDAPHDLDAEPDHDGTPDQDDWPAQDEVADLDMTPELDEPPDEPNEMGCTAPTPGPEACEQAGAQCGMVLVLDACGASHPVDCGGCEGGACIANMCEACEPETDEALCAREQRCAPFITDDRCGVTRQVSCAASSCDETLTRCDNLTGQCVCDDPDPCPTGRVCGMVTDACGKPVSCGTCQDDERCDEAAGVCECPMPTCPQGATCGTVTNDCGQSVSCGTCDSFDERCNTAQLMCECAPLPSSAQMCSAVSQECGPLLVMWCGQSQEIDCGGCPNDKQCRTGGPRAGTCPGA